MSTPASNMTAGDYRTIGSAIAEKLPPELRDIIYAYVWDEKTITALRLYYKRKSCAKDKSCTEVSCDCPTSYADLPVVLRKEIVGAQVTAEALGWLFHNSRHLALHWLFHNYRHLQLFHHSNLDNSLFDKRTLFFTNDVLRVSVRAPNANPKKLHVTLATNWIAFTEELSSTVKELCVEDLRSHRQSNFLPKPQPNFAKDILISRTAFPECGTQEGFDVYWRCHNMTLCRIQRFRALGYVVTSGFINFDGVMMDVTSSLAMTPEDIDKFRRKESSISSISWEWSKDFNSVIVPVGVGASSFDGALQQGLLDHRARCKRGNVMRGNVIFE